MTTTPATTSAPGVTVEQTAAFLTDRHDPGVSCLTALRQGGWSNAYAFDHAGTRHVIRFSSWRDDFDKDRYATRWTSPTLPVPDVSDIGEAFVGYFAISRHVPGIPLDDLGNPEFRTALPALLAMLDALRTADLTGTSGFGGWDGQGQAPFPTWEAYLLSAGTDDPAGRGHGWRQQLANAPVGIARFDEAYGHLADLVPLLPPVRNLIHSDLLNYNMLVDGPRISGVLDWGCGLIGDFLWDVAWFIHYWSWYPAWREIDFTEAVRRHFREIGLDVPCFEERIRCYRINIGLGEQAYHTYLRNWPRVEAAAARTLAIARAAN